MSDWRIDQKYIYEFSGNHYELGKQSGIAFEKNINEAFTVFKNLEMIKQLKPKILPTNLFFKIAESKAYKWLNTIFKKSIPEQTERIKGMADGSGISEKLIYLLASTELVLAKRTYEIPLREGCSTFCYERSKTSIGHNFASRNFDYHRFVLPFLAIRKNNPKGRLTTYDVTATPLPGTFNGFNEKGVFIGTNEGSPISEFEEGLPASMLIQEALETCETSDEVFKLFSELPRGSGNIVVVNDAEGNMFAMEYTSKRIHKRKTTKNYLTATNHYQLPEMKEIDLPRDALWGKGSDPRLIGTPILEDSYIRIETANKIMESQKIMSLENIQKLMSDHSGDPENKPGQLCLCRHDPAMQTACSMLVDLETIEAWISIGNPCENTYKYYNFGKSDS